MMGTAGIAISRSFAPKGAYSVEGGRQAHYRAARLINPYRAPQQSGQVADFDHVL